MIFRFSALLMTVYFAWATEMQRNDPDAILWIGIYGLMVIISALAIFKIKLTKTYIILGIAAFLYGAMIFPYDLINHQNLMNNEIARESLGLLIISVWLIIVGRPRLF